jgi:hypothetical protein
MKASLKRGNVTAKIPGRMFMRNFSIFIFFCLTALMLICPSGGAGADKSEPIRVEFKWLEDEASEMKIYTTRYALINNLGNFIVKPIHAIGYNFSKDPDKYLYIADPDKGRTGIIDGNGKWVIKPEFLDIFENHGDITARKPGTERGVIDYSGKWILSPKYNSLHYFNEDIIQASEDYKKYGLIDKRTEKLITKPEFNLMTYVGKTAAYVTIQDSMGTRRGLLNYATGEYILDLAVANDIECENELCLVKTNNKYGVMDLEGRWVVEQKFNKLNYFNSNFNLHSASASDYNNKVGYINDVGEWQIEPQYDDAGNFNSVGIAPVKIGNTFNFIDTKGNIIIKTPYDSIVKCSPYLSTGLIDFFIVKSGGKVGMLDPYGKNFIPPEFDEIVGRFSGAKLLQGKNIGFIDGNGEFFIHPQDFDDIIRVNYSTFVVHSKGKIGVLKNGNLRYIEEKMPIKNIESAGKNNVVLVELENSHKIYVNVSSDIPKIIFSISLDENGLSVGRDGTGKTVWPLGEEYKNLLAHKREMTKISDEIRKEREERRQAAIDAKIRDEAMIMAFNLFGNMVGQSIKETARTFKSIGTSGPVHMPGDIVYICLSTTNFKAKIVAVNGDDLEFETLYELDYVLPDKLADAIASGGLNFTTPKGSRGRASRENAVPEYSSQYHCPY